MVRVPVSRKASPEQAIQNLPIAFPWKTQTTDLPDRLIVLLAILAGTALRLWFIHAFPRITGDSWFYGDLAKNWLTHGIYGRSEYGISAVSVQPTLLRLPGYPAFLAVCFYLFGMEHYRAVLYVQAIVDLLTCLLVWRFVGQVCGRRTALFALFLAALCPFTANYVAAPLTETLSLFCVALGFYSLPKFSALPSAWSAALLTFSCSFAALLRPDGALLAVVLFPALIFGTRGSLGLGRAIRFALLGAFLAILPFVAWTLRNYHTFGVFQPLVPRSATDPGEVAPAGFVRWTKTWLVDYASTFEFYWNADSDKLDIAALPSRAFDTPQEFERTRKLLSDYNQITTLTPEIDARFASIAADRIQRHPLRYYVWLPALRLADMWLRPRSEMLSPHVRWWQYARHPSETVFALLYGLLNLAYLAAAFLGVVRWPRHALGWAMLAFIALRCILLATTVPAPETRYTLECFPLLIAFAAVGLSGGSTGKEPNPANELPLREERRKIDSPLVSS